MKRSLMLGLGLAWWLGVQPVHAGAAPVTLTVQSYRSLTNAVVRVVDTVAPGMAGMWLTELREGLGLGELKGVDLDRPWQVAVWLEGMQGMPCVSVRIPTTDFEGFKAGLASGSVLRGYNQPDAVRQAGDYGNIWIQLGPATAAAQSAHAAWQPEQLPATVSEVLDLEFRPGEGLREQLLGVLGMGRMMMVGTMAQQAENVPGVDGQAMAELMGAYFDLFQVALRGLETLNFGLGLGADEIVLSEKLRARPGSELAGWLDAGEGSLAGVMAFVSNDAPLALAMRWDKAGGIMPTLKKFAHSSLRLQGALVTDAEIKELDDLLDEVIPLRFGGGMDVREGFVLSGVYEFPGRDVERVYQLMRRYVEGSMQQQVGDEQPYREISWRAGAREIGGVQVDRMTMVLNLESPLFQMPEQKEMLERIWPGGKQVMEMARRGDRLYVGSPTELERLLTTTPAPAVVPGSVTAETVIYGRMNLLKLLPAVLEGNPMVPEEVAAQLRRVESAGTELTFQVDLTGSSMIARSTVPLQFLRSMARVMQ